MIDLTLNYKKGPVILKDIAYKEKVSKKYLEQITIKLMSAGLIKSIRGPKGGYVLNKSPDKISMLDIYRVLEEKIMLVGCLSNRRICSLSKTCKTRKFYLKFQRNIEVSLFRQNLKKLTKI